jgi:hypothetical protein
VLPPECVLTAGGGHDWRTWTKLWRQAAARVPMLRAEPAPGREFESGR